MSIEFRVMDDEETSMELEHDDFDALHDAFAELQRRTGCFVDPYGKTRLSPEYCQILISQMTPAQLAVPGIADLHRVLEAAVKQNKRLLVIGD